MKTLSARIALLAAAGLLSACAQHFPPVDYTADEKASLTELKAIDDPEAKLALGSLLFLHNQIDEADPLLTQAVEAMPKNPQAQAWHAANECKKAGRRGPWLMGFDKLWLVHDCLGDVNAALAAAPDDFVVQMVQMNTGAEVNMFGSLDKARATRDAIEAQRAKQPGMLTGDVAAQYAVTSAKIERVSGNVGKARELLAAAEQSAPTEATRRLIKAERDLLGGA
ncbi:hypothetical protein [Derxia gummosa]|uniref:Tetratricopeptide repeat protein n=1 Tax=Derxia gummosa DSM 723 TaxID=1121388 RepID=A0A8B6X7E0_9BURK|nr:hypothetical protein [Derxia gummosa]